MKKKMLIILLAIFTVISFLLTKNRIEILGIVSPSKSDVKKLYYANEMELNSICTFLQQEQYTDIRIELLDTTKNMVCYYRNSKGGFDKLMIEFSDSNIISDLEGLKKSGFIRIIKEYNYVFFQSWGSYGESMGLMNSLGEKPNISKLNTVYTFMEKIEQTDWYCYKEKFD